MVRVKYIIKSNGYYLIVEIGNNSVYIFTCQPTIPSGFLVLVNHKVYTRQNCHVLTINFYFMQMRSFLPFDFFVFSLILTKKSEIVQLFGDIWMIWAQNLLPEECYNLENSIFLATLRPKCLSNKHRCGIFFNRVQFTENCKIFYILYKRKC